MLDLRRIDIENTAKLAFKEAIFDPKQDVLVQSFLQIVTSFRENKYSKLEEISSFVQFTSEIEKNSETYFYTRIYDTFCNDSTTFYKQKQREDFSVNNLEQYIDLAESRIRREELLLSHFDEITRKIIEGMLRNVYFFNQFKTVLEGHAVNFSSLIRDNQISACKKVFQCFKGHEQSLQLMKEIFKSLVRREIEDIMQLYSKMVADKASQKDIVRETNFVEKYFAFFQDYSARVKEGLENSSLFNIALVESLSRAQEGKSKLNLSYLLPFYLDLHFNKETNTKVPEAKQALLLACSFFSAVPDKDYFIEIYVNLVLP